MGAFPELVRRIPRWTGLAGDFGPAPFLEKRVRVLDVEIGLAAVGVGFAAGGHGQLPPDAVPSGEASAPPESVNTFDSQLSRGLGGR
jgi:hypothetical protein